MLVSRIAKGSRQSAEPERLQPQPKLEPGSSYSVKQCRCLTVCILKVIGSECEEVKCNYHRT